MLKDHVGQGGTKAIERDYKIRMLSIFLSHSCRKMLYSKLSRKDGVVANSIELFEKELSLVHHSNRAETWDTDKTYVANKKPQAIFPRWFQLQLK